jgi:hypothetical protein
MPLAPRSRCIWRRMVRWRSARETVIILGGDAAELLVGDKAERLEGVGLPPARELLAKLRDHEVPVFV